MSDVAVRLGIVLVSGAAISMGGQWSVYGGRHRTGLPRPRTERGSGDTEDAGSGKRRPCYRCIWPKPLPSAGPGAGTCEEEGVFGPVVGIVGVQMAAEAMKVILGLDGESFSLHLKKQYLTLRRRRPKTQSTLAISVRHTVSQRQNPRPINQMHRMWSQRHYNR